MKRFLIALVLSAFVGSSQAAFLDDVGYALLEAELGSGNVPDGAGVAMTQVETLVTIVNDPEDPNDDDNAFRPSAQPPSNAEFLTKTFTNVNDTYGFTSGHAKGVGIRFYGNTTSMTPGISDITSYEVVDWIQTGFLQLGLNQLPDVSSSRVANHSWVATAISDPANLNVLRRVDWLINEDEFIQVVGFTGGAVGEDVGVPLLSSAFNVIAVNRTGHPTNNGSSKVAGDPAYATERTRPDLVAPESNASNATPRVTSAAALLVDTGHSNPSLSNGSTTNRNADTVYNAERSEVVKAALMAGADRATSNTDPDPAENITDYHDDVADQTANGLDRRYGAGQLNIFNSYQMIAAGEQDSDEDGIGGGQIGAYGFDYDPSFGGLGGSNNEASYFFSAGTDPVDIIASLAWNIEIDEGISDSFDQAATLYDLDLFLYDVSDPMDWLLLSSSESLIDNTENLWMSLNANTDYALQVKLGAGQADFNWDYGLAWQVAAIPVPAAV